MAASSSTSALSSSFNSVYPRLLPSHISSICMALLKLKKAVKEGLAEDAQKGGEEKLQKVHDKYIKQIDDMLAAKDKEIMTV